MTRRLFIESSSNARLKAVRRLARSGDRDVVLAEGGRALRAALDARLVIRELFVAPELFIGGLDSSDVAEAERRGARVVEVGAAPFRTLAHNTRPDGLLAIVGRPHTGLSRLRLPPDALVVVAAGIERPGNLGTIARTACALGADALIVADPCTDPFHRDVVRGSVATIFRLPVAATTGSRTISWLGERGVRILATTPHARTPYWDAHYEGRVAIVVGPERVGLPAAWLDAADERVGIPMPGPADSLNVAVAAGVVLCEAARRRSEATLHRLYN